MNAHQPDEPNRHLAAALRARRKALGWSLDRAAAETGVSKAMLGQIERGESSPTVATLWKIAGGFHASLSSLLAAPPDGDAVPLLRRAQDLRSRPAGEGMLVAALFPFEARTGFEIFELTLLPGYERCSEAHEPGVCEYVLVVRGTLEVLVEDVWTPLGEGEAMRFAADRPHGYRNRATLPVVFHDVIHYPARA